MIDLNNEDTKEYFSKLIDIEISNIDISLEKQKELNSGLFRCLNDFSNNVSPDMNSDVLSNASSELVSISKFLNKISFNFSSFEKLSDELENIKGSISIVDNKTINDIAQYNKTSANLLKQISANATRIEKFIAEKDSFYHPEINAEEDIEETVDNIDIDNEDVNILDNEEMINDLPLETSEDLVPDTLTISETDGKVVLPYKIKEVAEILRDNPDKYKSIEDVIDKLYTRPIKYYKNSSFARFKEAYNLMRKKETASISEAIDLGMELFSNYNLHPAIISACKNLNELDVYLSCLEYNELEDFNFFKVIFSIAPTAKKLFANNQALQKGKHTVE